MALVLLSKCSVAGAEHRLRGEILEELLGAPHRDLQGLHRRASRMGLDLTQPRTVLAARCRGGDHRRAVADAARSGPSRPLPWSSPEFASTIDRLTASGTGEVRTASFTSRRSPYIVTQGRSAIRRAGLGVVRPMRCDTGV
ncbi:hypothetical protein [Streptomyces gibsoniae]|uniref:Uncharacterized protein n=1 Tax=Streptomyces gibsoniae TaxID=3075529 RepID=A0ABU2U656_9ACTN|nr:hypothetical protein [Streptomyces sp. DSM 41699]MDT0468630.1 hypothetical protein [Streptomyces sp. DSM 41699]